MNNQHRYIWYQADPSIQRTSLVHTSSHFFKHKRDVCCRRHSRWPFQATGPFVCGRENVTAKDGTTAGAQHGQVLWIERWHRPQGRWFRTPICLGHLGVCAMEPLMAHCISCPVPTKWITCNQHLFSGGEGGVDTPLE